MKYTLKEDKYKDLTKLMREFKFKDGIHIFELSNNKKVEFQQLNISIKINDIR